ncbi:bacteriocin [Aliiglaciecola litoralis]
MKTLNLSELENVSGGMAIILVTLPVAREIGKLAPGVTNP